MENEQIKQEVAVEEQVKTEAPAAEQKPSKDQKGPRKFEHGKGPRKFERGKGPRRVEVKEFEERVVYINRVTKVVKGGKRMKFSALVVVGNGKGKYGFATGKSGEVPDAIKKSVQRAEKNTHYVRLVKAGTIAHDVVGKFGATQVFLKPAPEGTGIIAGGPVRAVLELCGVKNVYSKVYGSRTAINVIRATDAALRSLKDSRNVKALRTAVVEEAPAQEAAAEGGNE